MLADEGLQLAAQLGMATETQIGLHPLLDGDESQLLQSGGLGPHERLVAQRAEGRAVPQAKRPTKNVGGAPRRAADQRRPACCDQSFEADRIHVDPLDVQHVARPARDQDAARLPCRPSGLDHTPQVLHVGLQRGCRAGRRIAPPEVVDQPISRHDLVGVNHEIGQQSRLPGRPEHHTASVDHDTDRPEHTELHRRSRIKPVGTTVILLPNP